MQPLLTIPQAAARLKVSEIRVRVWVREKRIKSVQIGARHFIRKQDCKRPEAMTSWSSPASKKKIAARQKRASKTKRTKGGAA